MFYDKIYINHYKEAIVIELELFLAVLFSLLFFCIFIFFKFLKSSKTLKYLGDFEHLLMTISTNFIQQKADNVDHAIRNALKQIGEFFSADRSYVFLFSEYTEETGSREELLMSNTHEWCAQGVEPQIDKLKNIPQDILPWWMENIRSDKYIYIPDVAKMPHEAAVEKEILESQNIMSLIVLPLNIEQSAIGFIGFDFTGKSIKLSDNILKILRIVGEMIANSVERKRYESNLNAEKEFAQQIMNNMGQGLTITNSEKIFEYVNPAFSNFMGYDPSELIGKSPYNITKEENYSVLDNAAEQRHKGIKGSYETNLVKKDGTSIPVMITGVPRYKGEKIIGTTAVVTDLSEIKKIENSLRLARDKAFEATLMKSRFLANMSHEIRTPMVSIIGMLDILGDTPLNEEQKEYIETAVNSANHLLELINDILDYSRLEANQLKLEVISFDMRNLITDVYRSFSESFRKKQLEFIMDIDETCPRFFKGDPVRISQILYNLIGNSLKFTSAGSVKLDLITEKIYMEEKSAEIRIKISDTGIGINDEFMPSLFKSFQQEDGSVTRRFGGTGLGLSIVKNIVDIMNGKIEVESCPGKGTIFSVCLKLEIDLSGKEEEKIAGIKNMDKDFRVLIAEDNSSNRKVLSLFIEQRQWRNKTVTNGEEAYEAYKNGDFDLILMDIQMPVMDGITAIKKIRKWEIDNGRKPTLIFALSADSHKESREICSLAGADTYITKPVRKEKLYKKIMEYFESENRQLNDEYEKTKPYVAFRVEDKINELSVSAEEMYSLAKDFFKTISHSLSEFDKCLAEKNYELLGKKVHFIRSSAGFFADESSYHTISNIKKRIDEGDYTGLEDELEEFKKKIGEIVEAYIDYFKKTGVGSEEK